jgi:hypothetical protein
MQKLVIHTQYRENYAAHDEDYIHGVDTPHWKFKGGDTYVVPNFKDHNNITEVMKTLSDLITYGNPASEEYILSWEIVPQGQKVCEDWESPYTLSNLGNEWVSIRIEDNSDMGYMRSEILEKTSTFTLLSEGDRANYKASYLMNDGDIVDNEAGLREWFGAAA